MLYLPKAILAWYQMRSAETNIKTGRILVEVAIKHAFQNGFECDHHYTKFQHRHPTLPVRMERCVSCGQYKWVLPKGVTDLRIPQRNAVIALTGKGFHFVYDAENHPEKMFGKDWGNLKNIEDGS